MMASRAANEYGFVNARIRGMKSRFLSVGVYESLLQSKSYEDFIKILSSTYYGQVISRESSTAVPTPEDLALILSKDFAEVSTNLSRSITGKIQTFTKTYLEMFLAESVKSIIRGVHVGLDRDEILRFAVPLTPAQADQFSLLVDAGSVSKLIDLLPYRDMKVALLTKLPKYEEFDSTAPLEVALEEWHLKKVLNALKEFSREDQKRVLDLIVTRVALRNVLTQLRALILQLDSGAVEQSLIRFKLTRELTESIKTASTWREVFTRLDSTRYSHLSGRLARLYEETNDLSEVELAIEDYIAQRVKLQLTAFPFHLGTLTGFYSLKFYETRNLRSIAVGIERKESADVIRKNITIW
ncbi:MAG: V-type ATPase subunit [Candidatus Thorarchaeota archaeon]|jgi:V/A-type H+-transporting ATPase subunit C